MKTQSLATTSIATAVTCALLAACAAAPTKPEGAVNLRSRLTQLQSDADLGTRAPLAMKEADAAVMAAERPQKDKALSTHLMFVADRKIETARAQAESNFAVDQRKVLGDQRDAMRLESRTQEADSAKRAANVALAEAGSQRLNAESANRRADMAIANAQTNSDELQRQIDDLHAKVTDRGLVLNLGDVLFTSGTATMNGGGAAHLAQLVTFLNKYPERTTMIEGHTDSVGSDVYNQGLSQRRADAVKAYLVTQGISDARLTATGKGEDTPIGDNGSAIGRQQNRRVEIIISNAQMSLR